MYNNSTAIINKLIVIFYYLSKEKKIQSFNKRGGSKETGRSTHTQREKRTEKHTHTTITIVHTGHSSSNTHSTQ